MSLLDEAKALRRHNGSLCALAQIDAELRHEIEEAIAAGLDKTAIAAALKARGDDTLTAGALRRHFRGDCQCHS